jgi:ABC-type Co2+ transport system permease subunit
MEPVEGTINFVPFSSPAPVPAVFAVIPAMIVPVIPVVIPPLVPLVPLSGLLTVVVSKIVASLEPDRSNKSHTQGK